jgi:hypothetical protein
MSHVDGNDDGVGYGVRGRSNNAVGVSGNTPSGLAGVFGNSDSGFAGVYGQSNRSVGVVGESYGPVGVLGLSYSKRSTGVYGLSYRPRGYAAYLDGRVYISGPLDKPGGSFKIDHPLDPANKYLSHSFVESPDMKNVYDGVVVLDNKGEAVIDLPDWFAALNKDFRYQLLLLELLDQICILHRKYLIVLLETTVAGIITIMEVTSKLQEVAQV